MKVWLCLTFVSQATRDKADACRPTYQGSFSDDPKTLQCTCLARPLHALLFLYMSLARVRHRCPLTWHVIHLVAGTPLSCLRCCTSLARQEHSRLGSGRKRLGTHLKETAPKARGGRPSEREAFKAREGRPMLARDV